MWDRMPDEELTPEIETSINEEVRAVRAERRQRSTNFDTNVVIAGLLWNGRPRHLQHLSGLQPICTQKAMAFLASMLRVVTR